MRNPKQTKEILTGIFIFGIIFFLPDTGLTFARKDKEPALDLRKPRGIEGVSADMELPSPPEYFLSEDDVLDISVWEYIRPKEKKSEVGKEVYLIGKGDTLEISVWQWSDLLKDVIVRPDGKISYPLVGDIDAEGMTLTQLRDLLTEKLKAYIKEPQVSVMVKQFGAMLYGSAYAGKILDIPFVKVDDLSTSQVVRPDGKISFPLLGDIEAKGITISQLSKDLADKLSTVLKEPRVTISIKQFGGRKVIVLGEVNHPGVYRPAGETTLLEIIAMAGGYTKDAITKNVVVISGNMDKPQAKAYNLLAAVRNTDYTQNILIRGGEIIYIPRSHLSNLTYFLNQFVGPMTTASSATGYIGTIRKGTGIPGK